MSPLRFFPTLVAAACIVAIAACVDSPSGPSTPPPPAYIPPPSLVTLNGIVHVTNRSDAAVLETEDGDSIQLAGAEIARLQRVDGAEVDVRGSWDTDAAFLVNDFLVRAVGGLPAMDGVLTEMYTDDLQEEFTGYGLRLTRGVLIVPLTNPPEDLLEHLGERVWVTGALDGRPTAYGVIGRAERGE